MVYLKKNRGGLMRILLVEDEIKMSEALTYVLQQHHFTVDAVYDGESAYDHGMSNIYDVIVLDIMLPKIDGIEVLRRLRNENINTPIIMLSARGETSDRIKGLDHGADDYLPKPFQTEELIARIRALARRKSDTIVNDVLVVGDLSLHTKTLTLYCHNTSFELTLKEAQTLEYLMNNKNTVISKEMFLDKLWGFDDSVNDNTVEVYISFLRKKLVSLKSIVSIVTIRNVGYTLKVSED